MKDIPVPPLNEELMAGGYFDEGDGGGGTFIWVSVGTLPPLDQGIHIKHNTRTDGYFLRLYSGSISARWFGASANQVDNTAAIQAAIDYCIANSLNLHLDGDFRISSSLFIDRLVDNPAFREYFVISDGSLFASGSFPVFSTRLNPASADRPVTQLVRFREIVFKGDNANTGTYVLDSNKYLRTSFEGCSFISLKFLRANYYVQSIYISNCQARNWSGVFFDANGGVYDIKISTSIFESAESFANFSSSTSTPHRVSNVSITNNLIEGLSGYGIKYKLTSSLVIGFNYFEGNVLGDVICGDPTGDIGSPNTGISIIGNFHLTENSSPDFYPVTWGPTNGGISLSNVSNRNLDQFNTSVSDVFTGNAASWNDANTPDHFGTSKIYFGSSLPITNGGVVNYSPSISRGTIIWNTNITPEKPNAGWVCTEAGTYATAHWAAFGTTNALIENKSIILNGSEDLNTMTASGYFFPVVVTSWLNTGQNFPLHKRGMLKVYYSGNSNTADVIQEYTTISTDATDKVRIFCRTYYGYGGRWAPWSEFSMA